jgi:hypothetical protein
LLAMTVLASDFVVVGNKLVRSGSKGVIVPWTPADVATNAWHDASDESTVTELAGYVLQIDDKLGNPNRYLDQTVGSRQPAYTNTLNGLRVITFDGIDDRLGNTMGMDTYDWYFAVVAKPTLVSSRFDSLYCWAGNGNDWQIDAQSDTQFNGRFNEVGGGSTLGFGQTNVTEWAIWGVENLLGTGRKTVFNGADQNSGSASTWDLTSIALRWAGNRAADNDLGCEIAESVFVPIEYREKTEGYLAWKWGLVGSLPSDHPWKNVKP